VALKELDLMGDDLFEVGVEVGLEVGAVVGEDFTAAAELDAEVMIGVFAIEGLLIHPLDKDQQRSICDTLAARWIPTPSQ
jgi:hypothetical protein